MNYLIYSEFLTDFIFGLDRYANENLIRKGRSSLKISIHIIITTTTIIHIIILKKYMLVVIF